MRGAYATQTRHTELYKLNLHEGITWITQQTWIATSHTTACNLRWGYLFKAFMAMGTKLLLKRAFLQMGLTNAERKC